MSDAAVPANAVAVVGDALQLPTEFQQQLELSSFIPNIQLLQPLSEAVQNPPPNCEAEPRPGEYWLGQNTALGKSFDAMPFASKMHALLIVDRKVSKESFDHTDAIFKEIQQMDSVKRSLPSGTAPRWGADVLLWLPKYRRFAAFFLYSTARQQIKPIVEAGGRLITIKARIAQNKTGQKWQTPDLFISPQPLSPDSPLWPDEELRARTIEKFLTRQTRGAQASAPVGGSASADR